MVWWPLWPVLALTQILLFDQSGTRYYVTQERDAAVAVVSSASGWKIIDHVARNIGQGRGASLLARVSPALTAAADRAGTIIWARTRSKKLAMRWEATFPGTVASENGPFGWWRVERAPMTMGEDA
ncbi:hypothetical protein ACFOEP_13075 [Microbacterium amylolyticum]